MTLINLTPHALHMLQWGHDLAVMESTITAEADNCVLLLQWGHDLAVMERGTTESSPIQTQKVQSVGASTQIADAMRHHGKA